MTRCTAFGDRVALKVEGIETSGPTQLRLDHCLLKPTPDGRSLLLHEKTNGINEASLVDASVAQVELRSPDLAWEGADDSFRPAG